MDKDKNIAFRVDTFIQRISRSKSNLGIPAHMEIKSIKILNNTVVLEYGLPKKK